MADFGIINLQAEGDITSYDPPEALVHEFGTFHDEINDRIVSVMSLLPNAKSKPSIDKLRRTKEKPGAKRTVLKANKAFSKIEIPKGTPVLAELDDNDMMHIPFFQYANPDKYYVLENQGKSRKDILQQSVDLSKLKNRSDATPLTSYYHQDFDLKSEHPGVTFIDKQRASFAGFFTGPILDGHHNVALHGFLQEPVNIAVRSGFNTRVVKLPIGYEMVVPLKFGVIHYDEEGKPERWTTIPEGLKRLPPPPPGDGGLPEFPAVPTHPVGRRTINIPPVDPNILNIPSTSRIPPPDPSMLNVPSTLTTGRIPPPDPSMLDVPTQNQQAVEPPSLGNIEMPTADVEIETVEGVTPESVLGPTGAPSTRQRAVATADVERETVEGVTPESVLGPTGVSPTRQRAVPRSEGVQEAEQIPQEGVKEAEQIPQEAEQIPEGERRLARPKAQATVRTATVTRDFNKDVIGQMADYIKNTGVQIQDVEGELERYQPLTSLLNRITTSFPNRAYTIEMPSKTNEEKYDTFVDEARNDEYIARIAFNPDIVYEFRLDIDETTPSNIVERIDGRVNIVAVSRPVAFRMKPNPNLLKYTLFLRRGKPVVVARPAKFRMEPNESLREFVKIEP